MDQGETTQLTTISHQAPVRLIPLRSTQILNQGRGAIAFLSNYGAGLLPGDVYHYDFHVQSNARLGILTQGNNRIYKQKQKKANHDNSSHQVTPQLSQTHMTALVDPHALLVVAPDPMTPYANSAYRQRQRILLHPSSSLCFIDWFTSGRFANGEQWQQEVLETSTEIFFHNGNAANEDPTLQGKNLTPVLVDSVAFLAKENFCNYGMDWGDWQCNAFVTIFLYGSQVGGVQRRCHIVQDMFVSAHTRVRDNDNTFKDDDHQVLSEKGENDNHHHQQREEEKEKELDNLRQGLSDHRVFLSLSKVETMAFMSTDPSGRNTSPLFVVRMAAMSNEDLYRVLNYCLRPLGSSQLSQGNIGGDGKSFFGWEFYKERMLASKSSAVAVVPLNTGVQRKCGIAGGMSSKGSFPNEDGTYAMEDPASLPEPATLQSSKSLMPTSGSTLAMLLLADSSLPTGSFAHSSGLEVAAQLGLLQTKQHVQNFVQTNVQSVLQLWGPVVRQVHDLCANSMRSLDDEVHASQPFDELSFKQQIHEINQRLHLAVVSNGPSCMASLDQGRSLLRVSLQLAEDHVQQQQKDSAQTIDYAKSKHYLRIQVRVSILNALNSLRSSSHGLHLASVFGASAAVFEIPIDHAGSLLGYCVARDTVSAAVRLNLIGPLSSVALLAYSQKFAVLGRVTDVPLSSCAPVLDTIQACHNALAVRLFRS
ncbi:hypothetical protein ACA910_010670 [Epithemia clementina (nom. ined.)]